MQVDTLDNLSEKDYLNFYVDASYTEEKVPELWKSSANELADEVMKVDFGYMTRN